MSGKEPFTTLHDRLIYKTADHSALALNGMCGFDAYAHGGSDCTCEFRDAIYGANGS